MRFLKYIELDNYLNLKHTKLDNLKDLNIIIGPNNCGKTSLLRAVNLLSRISFGRTGPTFNCDICRASLSDKNIQGGRGPIEVREEYLARGNVGAIFGYNKGEIMKFLPKLTERQYKMLETARSNSKIREHLTSEFKKEYLEMKQSGRELVAEHVSPIIWTEVISKIFGHILFCPNERLQTYGEKKISDYIGDKNFAGLENDRLIGFLKQVVDSKISDIRRNVDLVRDIENKRFNTLIAEQGSGVKSLICLMADIISKPQTKILLIDEPELGLNPSSKHVFLRFLFEESEDKQIFLATHDPTFVNPLLWNRENVSVYLFSVIKNNFVEVNLVQSKQDPSTFAGFLPHTTSLKQVHIYVEGTTDVYNFQIFLDKYVKKNFGENWYSILNRIGIFHLAGDFWGHLLYTIPKSPYTSIVILDGDKRPVVKQVVKNYSRIDKDRFRVVENLSTIEKDLLFPSNIAEIYKDEMKPTNPCPIYCLKMIEIEDYLKPKPPSKDEGPAIAFKMKRVPKEIEQLFDAIFQMADIRKGQERRT